jgi:hypothetical protein
LKGDMSESVVLSVKLTLHVKVLSRSLVSSSGIKPAGLSATRVSAVFFDKPLSLTSKDNEIGVTHLVSSKYG